MTEAETISTILADFAVCVGEPERRLQIAQALAAEFTPAQVEKVGAFYEATTSDPKKVPGLLAKAAKNIRAMHDVLRAAQTREIKQAADSSPGARDREDSMEHEATFSQRDDYRIALASYQMLAHREASSIPELVRRLVNHFPERKPAAVKDQLPTFLETGARLYGHPCPKLASYLLMRCDERSSGLWTKLHQGAAFHFARSEKKAKAAEAIRKERGWPIEEQHAEAPA